MPPQVIPMKFTGEDLENVVSSMAACEAGKSKLFNALTSFCLLLLLPPKPFINKTISVYEYVDKLLESENNQL
jgi:hypothetical protein